VEKDRPDGKLCAMKKLACIALGFATALALLALVDRPALAEARDAAVTQLHQLVDQLRVRLDTDARAQKTREAELHAQIAELKTQLAETKAQLAEAKTHVDKLANRVGSQETALTNQTGELRSQMTELRKRVGALEKPGAVQN
jgi:septal ring factor EnvC (AmiA/AmiB activator)